MELWKEIFCNILQKECMEVRFPQAIDLEKIFELECYKALQKIKMILQDESLDDESCFLKIEEIVSAFEKIGSDGGARHDF